jgi:hypothetical protein
MRHRERYRKACGLQWQGFQLLKKLNSQLSLEPGLCYLGDRPGGVYDRVSHLEIAHDIWLKLCNTYEGSSKIKSSRKDTYNRQYQTFAQKHGESLDDCFIRFESIVSNLHSCGPLAYSDNERAKQLLYALDDHVWGMKITALKEYANFATIDTEKLFTS